MNSLESKNNELMQPNGGHGGRQKLIHRSKSNGMIHSRLKFLVAGLIFGVTGVIILLYFYAGSLPPIIDGIAKCLGYDKKQFAVVIDAGSTGTRVIAYEFHLSYTNGRPILDDELFKELKPGLSSYANEPHKGAATIVALIEDAKCFVPQELWATTPFVVKATAGLRLLDPAKAQNLLNVVRDVIQTSGFLIPNDAVEIMDGTDEGIFAWFTVNFLLSRLNGGNTVAALDLGGGSTQVTFVPPDPTKTPSLVDYIHTVPTNIGHVDVFTHSYLKLGIMAAKYSVLSNGFSSNETVLSSECVSPAVQDFRWKYGNVEYSVSGKANDTTRNAVDLERCQEIIRQIMTPLAKPRPVSLEQGEIAAFSYYYDRAFQSGLIDSLVSGQIELNDLQQKVREICANPFPNTDQSLMCLDLVYIAMLLEEGFGLHPTTKITLYKKIDNHEISWALGCAYNLLTKHTDKL